jgi:hypothetical protein
MGNKAVILIRPNLLVNGRSADLNLLKKIKATITTTNTTENIPVTKIFDNLKIQRGEIIIDFQVPYDLDRISVDFNAEVRNATKNVTEK